ncbi:Retrovirus-related Pol polyprotein from transposon gypsy [Eumeta japonica]|uniref:Retrovirus-related Pol polyprotein from transposon gypsy n=1 Tax=Eumeta variegata TaxID=151549 RepID=A0A4C1TFE3_EUMVA|nr:Retrovirus-related Pol polyprotein from transposon gypsy [Eumeta japonica]
MRTEHQKQVQNLEDQIRQVQQVQIIPENQRVAIEPKIVNESQVKLDVFKSLPVFDGNINMDRRKETSNINYTIGNDMYRERIDKLMKENNGTTTVEATIRTKTDEPIWTQQYPYPIAGNDFVNRKIDRLIKDGIIQRSNSPYNSPIWTVPKKGLDEDGRPKKRMVIDYQKLNFHTITDRYIIPNVNMTIQNLGKAKYFTLDLESGFHQVKIRKEDREKSAFCVNGEKYEFIRMPFALKNAPSIFQRFVDDILREYIGKFAYVYIDDVLIYSSSPEEHMEHIEIIFDALNKATLKVSDEKSKFFQTEVEYLGHIITHNKIATNPEKVEAIEKYPLPQTLKDLRGFLGMTGYYRKFVQGYAGIAKPLTIHLRGDIEAFNKLKNCLKEQVELFQPNFDKPFELTTDASNIAIGAVLSQTKKPIFFLSRTLSKTEENYSTNEKELLAIIWALQKLRNYIYGTTDLTIYTDHQSLTHAISEKNPNPKLKRWKAIIEDFGAKLAYKPGHQNVVADALSRQCINTSSIDTAHSAESSYTEIIKQVSRPMNAYAIKLSLYPTKN